MSAGQGDITGILVQSCSPYIITAAANASGKTPTASNAPDANEVGVELQEMAPAYSRSVSNIDGAGTPTLPSYATEDGGSAKDIESQTSPASPRRLR